MAFNPLEFLKNFKNIQARMGEMQEKAKDVIVKGSAGGDLVSIEINGKMELINIHVSSEVVDPDDIEMLEDLIRAAFTDALTKLKEKMQEEFSFLSNGLNLPPGFMGT